MDILHSVSRLTSAIATPSQKEALRKLRGALGGYLVGSNPVLDASIRLRPELMEFLRQDHMATSILPETFSRMESLASQLDLVPALSATR